MSGAGVFLDPRRLCLLPVLVLALTATAWGLAASAALLVGLAVVARPGTGRSPGLVQAGSPAPRDA